ncbi:centromere protein W [Cyprinodon tularosa]|uniref:Centromere protein W-like n=1 Tax=Cyprinodon variegatus TaxID=28743 RepID=A0A3Q2CD85_CYPVA|nr:PREDICTED: centromere protein W-like [Cyprinodon variegatus]XP_015250863.1 PREDICTED: centromere protein W-like [Cyprinodon variegatus]XP_038149159.1 centromere protein W [Cyprinodon tularosa]XP_038149160.1 centromere protein W [Cyprinodon tularosa]
MLKKPPKLKRTVRAKAKGNVNIATGSEAMIELLIVMFLKGLSEEAKAKAFEEKSATIGAHHVRAVSKKMLKKARG